MYDQNDAQVVERIAKIVHCFGVIGESLVGRAESEAIDDSKVVNRDC